MLIDALAVAMATLVGIVFVGGIVGATLTIIVGTLLWCVRKVKHFFTWRRNRE